MRNRFYELNLHIERISILTGQSNKNGTAVETDI